MPENKAASTLGLDEKVMVFIVMASETFKKKSSVVFRQYGLTFSQYSVLKYLVACDGGRDTVGNVGKSLLVTGANVTGLAKRMERAGLIERGNDSRDERITILQITPKGLRILETIQDIQEQHIKEYLQTYPPEHKKKFLAVLKDIVRKGNQQ